jgi:3'(2'), 5'-bisphosphate nucleotidase
MYLDIAIKAAIEAGKVILEVYQSDFAVVHKEDKSPLTLADKKAHEIIQHHLSTTRIPVLSEEGKIIPYNERREWKELWIVDPLDGTKEFIKQNGEFTVNIAFVRNGETIGGVIYQPVNDILYFGEQTIGAFKVVDASETISNGETELLINGNEKQKLPLLSPPAIYTIVASRSHLSPETATFIEQEKTINGEINLISAGSSLKLCMLAEGLAHIYPRFAPTMEWDIAAGHAILKAAGKNVYSHSRMRELEYNKADLHNDWFIAR